MQFRPTAMQTMTDNILLAVRHGETDWNAAGRFQGHSDISLNETGRVQATRNGEALRQRLLDLQVQPSEVSFLCSPLQRAVETMQIVLNAVGLPLDVAAQDARLKEASFGEWEGLTTHEVKQQFPLLRKQRKADRWNFRPPGGQSFADLQKLSIDLLATRLNGQHSVVVSHTGNIRVLSGLLQRLSHDKTMAQNVPHVGILSLKEQSWGLI